MKSTKLSLTLARLRIMRRHGFVLVRPTREWFLGLMLGIMLLVSGGLHAAFVFMRASEQTVDEGRVPGMGSTASYRAGEVRKTLEMYEARTKRFEELRGTVPPAVTHNFTEVAGTTTEADPVPPAGDVRPVAE